MAENEAPKRPLLGYNTLRQVTEWASGVRGGEPIWFVLKHGPTPDDPEIETWLSDPHASLSDDELEQVVIIPTHVGHGTGNRETIQYAWIGPRRDGSKSVNVIDPVGLRGDSVFWTQSAVEKFLVPYYASVSGAQAAQRVEAVLKLLGSPRNPEPADPPVVYALVHLPQSEYTDPGADARHRARAGLPARPGGGVPLRRRERRGAHRGVLRPLQGGAGAVHSARKSGSRRRYGLSAGRCAATLSSSRRAPALSPVSRRTQASS